jgi:hypothetical protein
MQGMRPRPFSVTVAAWLTMCSVAFPGWGIYDPVTNQQVSKSAGSKTCSGIADVAGTVEVKLYQITYDDEDEPVYTLKDSAQGTADNSTYHFWSATLTASGAWALGQNRLDLEASSTVRHTTYPTIVQ